MFGRCNPVSVDGSESLLPCAGPTCHPLGTDSEASSGPIVAADHRPAAGCRSGSTSRGRRRPRLRGPIYLIRGNNIRSRLRRRLTCDTDGWTTWLYDMVTWVTWLLVRQARPPSSAWRVLLLRRRWASEGSELQFRARIRKHSASRPRYITVTA